MSLQRKGGTSAFYRWIHLRKKVDNFCTTHKGRSLAYGETHVNPTLYFYRCHNKIDKDTVKFTVNERSVNVKSKFMMVSFRTYLKLILLSGFFRNIHRMTIKDSRVVLSRLYFGL